MQLSVEYMRRVNLGNYEHSELKVQTIIKEGENIDYEIEKLKLLVHSHLGIAEEASKNQLILPLETIKKPVEKIAEPVNTDKEEVAVNDQVKDEVKAEAKEKKKETKAKKSTPETQPVKKISKSTAYDRGLDTHKNLLGAFLDKKYPKWRQQPLLNKAVEASKTLNGSDFLDESGEILDSFKASFSQFMDN